MTPITLNPNPSTIPKFKSDSEAALQSYWYCDTVLSFDSFRRIFVEVTQAEKQTEHLPLDEPYSSSLRQFLFFLMDE